MKYLFLTLLTIILFNSCQYAEATELRKKIVVVDTGISEDQQLKDYMCQNGAMGSTDWIFDRHPTKHGTNIVDLIGSRINKKKYCVVSINMGPSSRISGYNKALNMVTKMSNVVALNLSIASSNTCEAYSHTEHFLIKKILQNNVKIHIAAGNDNLTLTPSDCNVYPACLKYRFIQRGRFHKNLYVIGSIGKTLKDGKWAEYSNTGSFVDFYINGTRQGIGKLSGTSQATAIATGVMFSK